MKKMTTKTHGSGLDIAQSVGESKDVTEDCSGVVSHTTTIQSDNLCAEHAKEKPNTMNLRPSSSQPAGFLRKLSFRDRRGSSPSPFMNAGVDSIIPVSSKYLKVPSSHSPSMALKLGKNS